MLVGESFGMKTESYRVLAAALGDLAKQGLPEFNTKARSTPTWLWKVA
jgi:hypothetical protein